MRNPATYRRTAAAISLVLAPVLTVVSVLTMPEMTGDWSAMLAEIDEAGAAARVSVLTFCLSQLPFIVAALAVGHLLRASAPLAGNIGATLAVVGGFGHAVFGGLMLTTTAMADDPANRETYADVIDQATQVAGPFAAMGLLGTVLGIIVLAVGLWRGEVGPRWVPAALGGFVVLEFAVSNVAPLASYAGLALYVAGFAGLAMTVARSSERAWSVPSASDVMPLGRPGERIA